MRRILVTGGSRGLGLELCRAFLKAEDASVVTVSKNGSPELRRLEGRFRGRLESHLADLAVPEERMRFVREAGVLDGVDAFVANAAVGVEGLLVLMPEEAIRRGIEVNLTSVMLITQAVVKGMLSQGNQGALVFVTSVAARAGLEGLSVYGATKGALSAFSRSLAREYGSRGIRSNCVVPGFLETEMTAGLNRSVKERIRRRTALGRLGRPGQVVGAVKWLIGAEASHVTGAEVVVDGGWLA